MKHSPIYSRLRSCSLRRALSLSASLVALGLTAGCDTAEYTYETFTSARTPQVVQGARRAPELNNQLPVSGQQAPMPPVPMSAPAPVAAGQNPATPSPYDMYDGEGKPMAAVEPMKAAPVTPAAAPQGAAPQPQATTNAEQPGVLSRWFGNDAAPAPTADVAMADDNVRKPLPGNNYVSTATSQTAPLASAPQTSDMDSKELSYPKLSSVPPASPRFNEIRNDKEQNLAELNAQQRSASESKTTLDNEVQNELADGVVLAGKSNNGSSVKPLIAPAPVVRAAPEPAPLPPVNVSSKPAFLSEPPKVAEAPLTPAPAPEIAAAPVAISAADNAAPATPPAASARAGNAQEFLDSTEPAASARILRASRYEQRRTHQSGY